MHAKGHTGLTFLLMSILMIPFGYDINKVTLIVLAAGLSALPDIDLQLQKQGFPVHHRGFTHSIAFAFIAGLGFAIIFGYTHGTVAWVLLGFFSGFMGVLSHLLGDMLTYMAFKPLWPFSDIEVSLGICKASNKAVNEGLMTAGSIALVIYFMLGTGSLSNFV